MTTACKAYITDGRIETVWSQPMPLVREKLNACIKLNEEYQRHFHRTKVKRMADWRFITNSALLFDLHVLSNIIWNNVSNVLIFQAKLENTPNERPFDFSEMYIFGKFDAFTRRLKKILDLFDTIDTYSHLSESKIEGKTTLFV